MPYNPQSKETTYEQLRDRLIGNINGLTNFVETSFNYVWTQAFSSRYKDVEVATLASQLSGWVDYSGGPITQEDLDALNIDSVTPEEVNEYMEDQDLDELAKLVGVDRDPGQKATGEVLIATDDQEVSIDPGVTVSTPPDEDRNTIDFVTTEEIFTATGETETTVAIEATDVGTRYNTTNITQFADPPSELQSVQEVGATEGGEDPETNDELRQSIKNAILEKSGGGTADGVRGYIDSNTEDVVSVSVDEFPTNQPPYVDVIVEGGTDEAVRQSIEESRPVGIEHNLVRPDFFDVNVLLTVESGGPVDTESVERVITNYISLLDLGDDVIRDKIIQRTMNTDRDIENIISMDVQINNERHLYQGTTQGADEVYPLSKGVSMENDGILEVTGTFNESSETFVEGNSFEETDSDSDGSDDAIDWSVGSKTPDTTTGNTKSFTFDTDSVRYEIDEQLIDDGITDVTGVLNGSNHTFVEGTDYEEFDDDSDGSVESIRWLDGGDKPDDGTSFEVTYTTGTYFFVTYEIIEDIPIDVREKANPNTITVSEN